MVNWNKRGLKKLKFWKIILWNSQWGRLIGTQFDPFWTTYLPLLTMTSLNLNVDKNRHFDIKYLFWGVVLAYIKNFRWDQKCESKCESHSLFCINGKPNKFCLSTLLSEFFFTSFTAPYWPLFFLTNIEGWMPSRFFEEKICQKTMPYECVRNCKYFPCERKIMIMIQFFFSVFLTCWFKKYVSRNEVKN